jgi:membrane protease YdiL (CAAX protease family)
MSTPRYFKAALFVAVYIVLGFQLRLDAEAYLLLGIPLMMLFQLLVVRKPLHALWLREEVKLRFSKRALLIALCLVMFPLYKIAEAAGQNKLTLINGGYYSAAALGALGAGYCFSRFTKKTARDFFLCLGIVGVIRASMYLLPLLTGHDVHPDYLRGLKSLLLYVPVAFVVEEVLFRGMLDTYVHPVQSQKSIWSALFISVLWGLWHLPLSANGENPLWFVALASTTISIWGIPLSLFWRRSGNLAVPAFSHAFADAIRDALK